MANLRVDKITSTETFETTGSVQFNQNNDNYFSGTITAIGTQDFTIECWVYLLANRAAHQRIFGNEDGAFDSNTLNMRFTPNTTIEMYYGGTNVASDTLSESTWYHIAMSYSDNIARCYVDGKEFGRIIGNTDLGNTTMFIGGTYTVGGENFNGHVSNARLIVGKGIYPKNFKPPMRELEVTPETVLLACQSKTDKLEERSGNTTLSATGTLHSASELTPGLLTPVPKSGAGSAITGSVEFGENDYLTLASSSDFNLGTGDFTIEFWIHPQKRFISYPTIFEIDATDNANRLIINFRNAATLGLTSGTEVFATNVGFDLDEWYHIAVVRESGVSRIYKNGITGGDTACTADFSNSGSSDIFIGWDSTTTSTEKYNGFISNLRVVKGTALYTDDFIPPTRELKKVPGTVLLCCQDSNDPTTEATGKTITGYGNLERIETERVTNGTFDTDSDWTKGNGWSISGGSASHSGPLAGIISQDIITVPGKKYIYTIDVSNIDGAISLRWDGSAFNYPNSAGTYSFEVTASGSSTDVSVYAAENRSVTIDNFSVKPTYESTASNFTPQVGDDRKVSFEGVTKINTENYFYLPTGNTESRERIGNPTSASSARGLFAGGYENPATSDIEYFSISSKGNNQSFGDLTSARTQCDAVASSTRGVIGGGYSVGNTIDYVTIASTGNAKDFGDMNVIDWYYSACSSATRGLFGGGLDNPANTNAIEYITIHSMGNALDFGDLSFTKRALSACQSPTRGIFAGGYSPALRDNIEFVTFTTTGNTTDFGDITARRLLDACSNPTRGLISGGYISADQSTIEYITIASTGDALDFGDLTNARRDFGSTASKTRGIFGGGGQNPSQVNTMEFVEIMSSGNAVDFGDLFTARASTCAFSNGHGGLG